jgi:uridine kinase
MKPGDPIRQALKQCVTDAIRESSRKNTAEPWVAAIGGYPCIGKTRLALDVTAAWEGPSFILPTESAITARADRLARGHDGSSVESHDMPALIASIRAIRQGRRLDLPRYSWLTGDFAGLEQNPALDERGLLLIDGSVATTQLVLAEVDVAFALRPDRLDAWIELAVARDVAERCWDKRPATEQNQAKDRTVADQLAGFGRRATEHLLRVPVRSSDP